LKRGDFLRHAVFEYAHIFRTQSGDETVLLVHDRERQIRDVRLNAHHVFLRETHLGRD
jgi:hypothetical protein